MLLFSGSSHPVLAVELSQALQLPLSRAIVSKFADGETKVEIQTNSVRNNLVILVQTICRPANDQLIELLLLTNALQKAGARKIVAVVPYMAYMRQDYLAKIGTALSNEVVANMLNHSGIDHLITMDLHSPNINKIFTFPAENLPSTDLFAADLCIKSVDRPVFVAPDMGALNRATMLTKIFAGDIAIVLKKRGAQQNIQVRNLINTVENRNCVIVDDILDSGSTLQAAATFLTQQGARHICAYVTHAVLSKNARQNLLRSTCQEIIVSNSIPQKINTYSRLRCLSIAPLLAAKLRILIKNDSRVMKEV